MNTVFKDPLLDEVEAYLSQSQVSATEFGREAVNDGSFVTGLRAGRETRRKTVSRVRQYMRDNPPAPTDLDPKPPLATTASLPKTSGGGAGGVACDAVIGDGERAA